MVEYTAINDQSSYDLSIQQFGTLNSMDKVLRQIPDINKATAFGDAMVFDESDNNLARRFSANDNRFATGLQEFPSADSFRTFDNTFDSTFY